MSKCSHAAKIEPKIWDLYQKQFIFYVILIPQKKHCFHLVDMIIIKQTSLALFPALELK